MIAPRLLANLKVMMQHYAERNIIIDGIFNADIDETEDVVNISYLVNCYENVKNLIDEKTYDEYRSKLLYYCIRTGEMLTKSNEIVKVNIDECMKFESTQIDYVTKRMVIYG